eukprot:gene18921-20825_t
MAGHFSEFGLLPELVQGIDEIGWMLPTDIQAEAIPLILGGGDVLMAAETGSGKTGAFCLPIIQIAHETLRDAKQGKRSNATQTGGKGSKWVMSAVDREPSFAIDETGTLCQSREHMKWQGCRANIGVTKGKWYYEATVTDEGLCRVGFSTEKATYDVGTDKESFGFGGTGKKSTSRQFDSYGEPFGINDTIGCYIDLENNTIMYSKNGMELGKAFDIPRNLHGSAFFPSVTLKNAELKFNFGHEVFKHDPAGGYKPICKAPLDSIKTSQQASSAPPTFTNICSPSCVIMEPSRELAIQTNENIKLFKKYIPSPKPSCTVLVGGADSREMIRDLESGMDIVTGTPGKLIDFISTGKLKLDQVRFFILDEADGLLAQKQRDTIEQMYRKCPKFSPDGKRLQMIVCSATLHNLDVKRLAEKLMHFPTWIDLKGQDSVPDTVHHVVCKVDPSKDQRWKTLRQAVKTDGIHMEDNLNPNRMTPEMMSEAIKILKAEYLLQAISEHNMDQAIIFCRTKLDCDNIEKYLNTKGGPKNARFSCVCLHSDRGHKERQANLAAFKSGAVKFLICTDVAARGIDIKGIPFVVNVTLPDDKANYIHRIGRVGRAERMGLAISLAAANREKVWYHKCESRGRGCYNTRLVEQGGCSIWYNEMQYLADIEEHLGETISMIECDFKIPVNEFDGKVVYGQKRSQRGGNFAYHTAEIASFVRELASLEKRAQTSFLKFKLNWQKTMT